MARTSKTLRRLSVPVLVTSVIMTGVSFVGFAGVANAAANGTLTLTADNTGTGAANDPYATIQDDPYGSGDDTITVTAAYAVGTDPVSSGPGNANAQVVTFTVTGSAVFTTGPGAGTNTTTCTMAAAGDNSCTATVTDPVSEAPVVTASITKTLANPGNDPTVAAKQITLHIASLHFNNCAQTGPNTTDSTPTEPENYCYSQQTAGAAVTQTVTYLQDGQPKANVSLEIDLDTPNSATFAASQPTGSAFYSVDQVNCNTNAQGQCSFTYTDATAGDTQEIYAYTVANTGLYPNSEADEVVDFIASSTPARIEQINSVTLKPGGTGGSRKPGVVQEVQYQLLANDCEVADGDFTCEGTPLANRAVALTVDHGFFTRNCSVNGTGGNADGTRSYAQCTFNPTPTAGSAAGNLASLGTTINVTTDADGYFYASLAIARDTGFDDDGEVFAAVSGVATGSPATLKATETGVGTEGQTCAPQDDNVNDGCPIATRWTTDTPPLNGGTISFVGVHNDVVSGNPNNVPLDAGTNSERDFVVHLTDQFGNLTSDRFGSGVDIDSDGVGGTNYDGSTVLGSFTDPDFYYQVITADSADAGLLTVTGTWQAPTTKFTTYTPRSGNTPAVAVIEKDTVEKTATVKFNYYDQLVQPVVTFSTSPSNTVSKGTAVTVSATVKDQFGAPIEGQRVTFLVTGPNQSSCTPTNNTTFAPGYTPTNAQGQAGFVFSCNTAGQATVSIVVTDPSNNELGRGVQNVTFTDGTPPPNSDGPAFTINTGTIKIGQCATLRITAGGPADVLVKGQGAKAFTKLKTLPQGGAMAICPSTNSLYQVSNAEKLAPQQLLLVKAIQTLVVKRVGQSANFSGHVIPGVVGRRVDVFYYTIGEHVQYGGLGKVEPGGNFSFSGAVNRPGKVVYFFARTYKDAYNTSGQSPLVKVQF
jgi:hypothetical protein